MAVIRDLLLPYQIEAVRAGRVEYGDVERVTIKRASSCRCCGETIAKCAAERR